MSELNEVNQEQKAHGFSARPGSVHNSFFMTAKKDVQHQIQLDDRGIVLVNEGYTLDYLPKSHHFFIKKFYLQILMVISNVIVLLVDTFPSVEF